MHDVARDPAPWTAAWAYRDLVRHLVGRDLRHKYKGSTFGFAWSLANPLLMAAIYTLAFAYIVRVPVPRFPLYLLSGLLPWTFFAGALALGLALELLERGGLAFAGLFGERLGRWRRRRGWRRTRHGDWGRADRRSGRCVTGFAAAAKDERPECGADAQAAENGGDHHGDRDALGLAEGCIQIFRRRGLRSGGSLGHGSCSC